MASIMHALEVPAKTIASRMGHADTQVLVRHYNREFDAQDREAAQSMAAALREARQRGRQGHNAEGRGQAQWRGSPIALRTRCAMTFSSAGEITVMAKEVGHIVPSSS